MKRYDWAKIIVWVTALGMCTLFWYAVIAWVWGKL